MTHADDTRAVLSAQTATVIEVVSEKDKVSLDLAAQLDTAETTAVRLTKERDDIQTKFDQHMLTVHPVVQPPTPTPTPPPATGFKTLFGMGGGNVQRKDMDLDRRYYGSGDKVKAIADINTNEAKGILTWASFKCPFSWARMAAGEGNSWAKDLFTGLINEVKPASDDADAVDQVWVSIHHEPENDDDEDLWRQFQGQLAPLVPGGPGGPLKYFLTTTGWAQEFSTNRVALETDWETNLFPVDQAKWIYGIGYDAPYNTYGKLKDGTMNNSWTDPFVYVDALARRGVQFGVETAIGEWGYSDEAFAKDKTWAQKVMDRCISNPIQQVRGAAYFDTTLNSSHSWTLGAADSAKRRYMMALIANRRAV